tara:strand:- start:387 stop:578 length:192 start_codon:yes stop_codon:yes gene_type:complete
MFRNCICLILIVFCVLSTYAQPGPPDAPCWPPPCIPIDGGITIFGIIAAIFGYRIISKNNKIS